MRLLWLALGFAVLFLIPFVLWGDALEAAFSHAGVMAWLGTYGRWAWAAALGLLVGDLLLPIPASVVMTALGLLYGPVAGGLIGAAGSFLAGAVAYGLCRGLGRGAAAVVARRAVVRLGSFVMNGTLDTTNGTERPRTPLPPFAEFGISRAEFPPHRGRRGA